MNDNSLLLFGPYEGTKLINVPASHLLHLQENGKTSGKLKQYIERNSEILKIKMSLEPKEADIGAKKDEEIF